MVEVDADGDQHHKDRRDDPVDDQAERRPPASIGDIVAPVLPEVLDPMAGEASDQHPRRSGDPAAATTTKTVAMPASTAITVGRPSATAKPM